jgi:hypothetical protein
MRTASGIQNTILLSIRSLQSATLPDSDKAWLKSFWIPRFLSDVAINTREWLGPRNKKCVDHRAILAEHYTSSCEWTSGNFI